MRIMKNGLDLRCTSCPEVIARLAHHVFTDRVLRRWAMLQACSFGWPLPSFQDGRAARQCRTVLPRGSVIVYERLRGGLDSM